MAKLDSWIFFIHLLIYGNVHFGKYVNTRKAIGRIKSRSSIFAFLCKINVGNTKNYHYIELKFVFFLILSL